MALRSTKLLPRLATAIGLFMGQYWSPVNAYEGDLIIPTQGKSNLVFDMRNEQPDIVPAEVFQVFVGNQDLCCEGRSALAGRYSIDKRTVTFVPAFDFIEGQTYTVNIPGKGFNEFNIKPSTEYVRPEVVAIFPSGSEIPENTLRFYIHFSTPMRPGVSGDYIKLLNAAGTPDTAAFMEFKQELWSEDRKRLTLLIDPGRIKRGVAQNLTLGSALQEGNTYSIVVEEGWPTANGAKEMPRFERVFTVSKALRTLPDPELWSITAPNLMTNDPLVIEFDRPFDSELLRSKNLSVGTGQDKQSRGSYQ